MPSEKLHDNERQPVPCESINGKIRTGQAFFVKPEFMIRKSITMEKTVYTGCAGK